MKQYIVEEKNVVRETDKGARQLVELFRHRKVVEVGGGGEGGGEREVVPLQRCFSFSMILSLLLWFHDGR